MNRRQFIRNTGLTAAGAATLGGLPAFAAQPPSTAYKFGLQLFTFFMTMDQDVEGTLKKIADLGYTEIESAFSRKGGYYGKTAKEFAAMLKSMGLNWKSHHVTGAPFNMPASPNRPANAPAMPPMKNLKENHEEIVHELSEVGVPFLVCASTPIRNSEEVKQSADILHTAGTSAKKAGITLAYHNHEAEFKALDGKTPYEVFLSIPPDLLKFELDLAWATKAGTDPVQLFRQHPGRFPLWHVKDLDAEGKPCPVGQGTINFKPIFAAAKESGLQQFFVEHDMPADGMASIAASKQYLDKLLG